MQVKFLQKLHIPYRDIVAHEVQELTSSEVAQEINELDGYVPEETMVSILVEKGTPKCVESPKRIEVHAATRCCGVCHVDVGG